MPAHYLFTNCLQIRMKPYSKYNIVCFGFLSWSNMWKRNQSMIAEMAKYDFINRVIFVNPLLSIRSFFGHKNIDEKNTIKYCHKIIPSHVSPQLVVYTPINILPYKGYLAPFKSAGIGIILKIIRQLNADKPYILFMNCPNIFSQDLLDQLLENAELSIFDFSDDFSELGFGRETTDKFSQTIAKYTKTADIVLTVNEHIKRKYEHLNSSIHVVRNATNYDNFERKDYKRIDVLESIRDKGRPIIGYSGLANISRIDTDLLDFLLEERRDWQFVFVGPVKNNFATRYCGKENYHCITTVDYESLPNYLNYFDVAIVPFKINEHTRGNDLLKLHDYLAMGKPVVATDIGGADDLRDVIRIARSRSDFLNAIEQSLYDDTPDKIKNRKNTALKNSWQTRIKQLEDLIRKHLAI